MTSQAAAAATLTNAKEEPVPLNAANIHPAHTNYHTKDTKNVLPKKLTGQSLTSTSTLTV